MLVDFDPHAAIFALAWPNKPMNQPSLHFVYTHAAPDTSEASGSEYVQLNESLGNRWKNSAVCYVFDIAASWTISQIIKTFVQLFII